MANSTTNLDLISSSQASKEITANAMFDAESPASLFGRQASQTNAATLTWGYYGGTITVDGVLTQIANGKIALAASVTNYLEADRTGAIFINSAAFTPGRTPLYTITTGASNMIGYTDYRVIRSHHGRLALSVAGGVNVTLTQAQALCDILEFSGALTANINVIMPLAIREWRVFNNTTGAFTLTLIGATGTGTAIGQTKRAIVYADGINIVRLTPDT